MNIKNISKNKKVNKIKSRLNLDKVRSKFVLKKIFEYIPKNIKLEIIRYNKNIQNKLNLDINKYKEYSQIYSSIIIEIEIKRIKKFDKFINIIDKDKKYYHFYFDDNKEEIKRDYFTRKDIFKKIKIIIDYQVKSLEKLFSYVIALNQLILKNLLEIILQIWLICFYFALL